MLGVKFDPPPHRHPTVVAGGEEGTGSIREELTHPKQTEKFKLIVFMYLISLTKKNLYHNSNVQQKK